jgi:hypothetical protein
MRIPPDQKVCSSGGCYFHARPWPELFPACRHKPPQCTVSHSVKEASRMPVRHREQHRTEHIGWWRAAVLGANDGILFRAKMQNEVNVHAQGRDDSAANSTGFSRHHGAGGTRPGTAATTFQRGAMPVDRMRSCAVRAGLPLVLPPHLLTCPPPADGTSRYRSGWRRPW